MEETTTTTTMEPIYFPNTNGNKPNIQVVAIVAAVIALVMIVVMLSVRKEKQIDNPFIKAQIDSLAKANDSLKIKQSKLDSISAEYQVQIDNLDWKVQNVGEKKTIIREYYHEKASLPVKYTPKQVDSFFKKRYNY